MVYELQPPMDPLLSSLSRLRDFFPEVWTHDQRLPKVWRAGQDRYLVARSLPSARP